MAEKIVVNIITGEIISGEITNHPFANKAELYKEVVRCRDGCLRLKTEVAESDRWDNNQKIELDLMAKEYADKEKVPSDEFSGFQIMAMEQAYKDGYRARQLHEKQEFATMNNFMYMNLQTGSVGHYDDWDYETEYGLLVNAVDRGEVVRVEWDFKTQTWSAVEIDHTNF